MMTLLKANRKRWEAQEAVEQAEETHTELSDADPEPEISEEDEITKGSSETPSIIDFIAPPPKLVDVFICIKVLSIFFELFQRRSKTITSSTYFRKYTGCETSFRTS